MDTGGRGAHYCPGVVELVPGLYEQLVTEGLDRRLRLVAGDRVDRSALDPADAHEVLTRHLATLVSRALRQVGGSDRAAVVRQVELANRITAAIESLLPGVGDDEDAGRRDTRSLAGPGDRGRPAGRCSTVPAADTRGQFR